MALALVDASGNVSVPRGVDVNIPANGTAALTQCMSYRERDDQMSAPVRNKREIFLKGFAENIRFDVNSAYPLMVRRVIYATPYKITLDGGVSGPTTQDTKVVTSKKHYVGLGYGPKNVDVPELVLAGTNQVDWNDIMTAKIDNTRIRLFSDKMFSIRSGNTADAFKQFKFYDRINRKATYDDEESANSILGSGWLTEAHNGDLQNVYCTYFLQNLSSTNITPTIHQMRTMYWHEK